MKKSINFIRNDHKLMKQEDKNTKRKNPLKIEMEESVQLRVSKYTAHESVATEYLKQNPDAPQQRQEADKIYIAIEVEKLECIFKEVVPYIFKIRGHVTNVLDQNKLTASYFLFGKIFQSWQALFLLARGGFHYEVMELLRSIKEAEDLMFFFMNSDDQNPDLKKWFTGEIVGNEKARKSMHGFMNEENNKAELSPFISEAMAGVYGGLSKYTHVSYGALLDSYNVFSRDFDFERVSGFHYTRTSSLPFSRGTINGTIVALKFFYQSVKDKDSYDNLDLLLRKNAPEMYDEERSKEIIQGTIKKFHS